MHEVVEVVVEVVEVHRAAASKGRRRQKTATTASMSVAPDLCGDGGWLKMSEPNQTTLTSGWFPVLLSVQYLYILCQVQLYQIRKPRVL